MRCGAETLAKECSQPLLGTELQEVSDRHAHELDELGVELRELRLHRGRTEPRLVTELQENRRLRLELSRTSREVQLCERALEQSLAEEVRWESSVEDSAMRMRLLEEKAVVLTGESREARRLTHMECEQEEVQAQRQVLLHEMHSLSASRHTCERHVQVLSAAAAQRAVELGIFANGGSAALYDLADAIDTIADVQPRVAAAAIELGGLARQREVAVTELDHARKSYLAEVNSAPCLRGVELSANAARGSLITETAEALDAEESLRRAAVELLGDCRSQRVEIRAAGDAASELGLVRRDLVDKLASSEVLVKHATEVKCAGLRTLTEEEDELRWRLSGECQLLDRELRLLASQEVSPESLMEKRLHLTAAIARAIESCRNLERRGEDATVEEHACCSSLHDVRQDNASLLARWRSSLEACGALEACVREEHDMTALLCERADSLNAERLHVSEEVNVATRRCEETLALVALDGCTLRDYDARLDSQLSSREVLQTELSTGVAKALSETEVMQGSRTSMLRELAALRHESSGLRRLIVADDVFRADDF